MGDSEKDEFLRSLIASHGGTINGNSLLARVLARVGVTDSADLMRIINLPYRRLDMATVPDLTPLFARPGSDRKLWPIQNAMLLECERAQGLFGAVSVGGGKALTSFLLPYAVKSKRTVLFVPAARKKKTERLMKEWDQYFKIPHDVIKVYSYNDLQGEAKADLLEVECPDFVIFDEAQNIRHKDTNRYRRLRAFHNGHPETKYALLTGTPAKSSIKDYAHLVALALKDRSPVPLEWRALEEWSAALDPSDDPLPYGALEKLCRKENHNHASVPSRYFCRLSGSVGVVATGESAFSGVIRVAKRTVETPAAVKEALETLRKSWQVQGAPEDASEEVTDALSFARFVRQCAYGLYLRWDWPNGVRDEDWLSARATWNRSVRHLLRYSRDIRLDSALRISNAARSGALPKEHLDTWAAWCAVKERKQPPTVARWIDRFIVEDAAQWAREGQGRVVWYDNVALGEAIAQELGTELPRSESDLVLDGSPQVLSVNIFGTGLDALQSSYYLNLYTTVPNAQAFEQITGRTAREGQTKDVSVELYTHTPELSMAFEHTIKVAKANAEREGQEQLLLMGL